MTLLLAVEIFATFFSLGYLVLLIKQSIWCWPLAIISAILSIYLFSEFKLYSEAILYGYYVIIAIYGWWSWSRPNVPIKISTWKMGRHLITLFIGAVLSMGLGYTFQYFTDADKPFLDATTTIFSFIASILEAKKILSSWVYWIAINFVTVGMYFFKSLDIYAIVMIIYFFMSIVGYKEWRKSLI
jgi:nicotinamide mononucleotide transporter